GRSESGAEARRAAATIMGGARAANWTESPHAPAEDPGSGGGSAHCVVGGRRGRGPAVGGSERISRPDRASHRAEDRAASADRRAVASEVVSLSGDFHRGRAAGQPA